MSYSAPPRPVSILYIDVSHRFGGTIVSLLSGMRYAHRDKHRPLVICRSGRQLRAFQQLGITARGIRAPRFPKSSFRVLGRKIYSPFSILTHFLILSAVLTVAFRLSRTEGFHLVHGNALHSNVYASVIGIVLRKPVVWHINDYSIGFSKAPIRFMSRRVSRLITISVALKEHLVASGIPEKRIEFIYQPVDADEFRPYPRREARERLDLDAERPAFGFVGRLDEGKGLEALLVSGSKVFKERPDALLVVAGEGKDRGFLERIRVLVEKLNLRDSVVFLGMRNDVPIVMSALDVLVLPSTTPEGFGRVLAEALACGTPVIASDLGGMREIVEHGKSGFLVPPGDADALAESIVEVLRDPDRAAEMGRLGRERVISLFSPEAHRRKLEKLYEEILAG